MSCPFFVNIYFYFEKKKIKKWKFLPMKSKKSKSGADWMGEIKSTKK
jgi:hypothetical protein